MRTSFGSVMATGEIENAGTADWTVRKGEAGAFHVELDTPDQTLPVVIASGSLTADDLAADNVVTVQIESPSTFTVRSRDVAGWRENEPQDAGFSFVVYWT